MIDKPATRTSRQLLHLVFGGELESVEVLTFRDLDKIDIVGIFPDYASAQAAWRAKAQQTVDNAEMRYFVVHLHRLLDPSASAAPAAGRH
jgi:hypothetical protein